MAASAYEGTDDLGSFPDEASLERYRSSLVERTAQHADFLGGRLPEKASVLEVGCGNGRLLIELARRKALVDALGVDLATSRIAFAQRWAEDEGLGEVRFAVGDALALELPEASLDCALCITGAFGYFDAQQPGSAAELAVRLKRALRPAGFICLEIYPHPAYRRLLQASGGSINVWSELPRDDPWRFYLSSLSLDEAGEILTHEKTFIHRTSGIVDSGRLERLYLYTAQTVTRLLLEAGFGDVRAYEGWTTDAYDGGEVMVVTGLRPSPR